MRWNILLLFIPLLFPISCTPDRDSILNAIHNIPAKIFENYTCDFTIPAADRIYEAPVFLLDYLMEMDNVTDYKPYFPSEIEQEIFEDYFRLLPELNKNIMEQWLVGIFFIENFIGSGMADYVLDENDELYTIMILNPDTLKNNISDWLTYRENTCFRRDGSSIKIKVDCGTEYLGLMYALLHESTHIVDYIMHVTPYVETYLMILQEREIEKGIFTESIWLDFNLLKDEYEFENRDKVTFYGLGGGPLLDASYTITMFDNLSNTPLVSLYAGMNWQRTWQNLSHGIILQNIWSSPIPF
jgi:hypothetical protein